MGFITISESTNFGLSKVQILVKQFLLFPNFYFSMNRNRIYYTNNNTRSLQNITPGWGKYYFDFKTYKI